jgi:hypothetical protein
MLKTWGLAHLRRESSARLERTIIEALSGRAR